MIKNLREYEVMANVEEGHWWYRSLHYLVLRSLKEHFHAKNIEILDAGCGTGGLLRKLKSAGYSEACGFDLSEYAVKICVGRDLNVKRASLTQLGKMGRPGQYNAVACLDALCYLTPEERVRFFLDAYNLLVPGGLLITNQAALSIFRGTHDRVIGISHRFNQKEFKFLAKNAGFEVPTMFYWPLLFAPIILIVRTIQRMSWKPNNLGPEVSDLRIYPNWLNVFLYSIFRLEESIFWSRFMGSSLYAVLKKPTHEHSNEISTDDSIKGV
jgi:SAM-dependent methyltransferase